MASRDDLYREDFNRWVRRSSPDLAHSADDAAKAFAQVLDSFVMMMQPFWNVGLRTLAAFFSVGRRAGTDYLHVDPTKSNDDY